MQDSAARHIWRVTYSALLSDSLKDAKDMRYVASFAYGAFDLPPRFSFCYA